MSKSQPLYLHVIAVVTTVGASLGLWNVSNTPNSQEISEVTDTTAARVMVLANDVEWLKAMARSGCKVAPAEDDFSGPPPSLAPLPRLRWDPR